MLRLLCVLVFVYAVAACGDSANSANNHNHDHAGHHHDHEGHDHDHSTAKKAEGKNNLGAEVNPEGAMSVDQVIAKIESGEGTVEHDFGKGEKVQVVPAKIEAVVAQVCQTAGCWLTVQSTDGKELFVDTEHKFVFPKDITGKTVVIDGNAYKTVQTAEELRHNAKDEGKSEEEIAAITEPISNYILVAKGAFLK